MVIIYLLIGVATDRAIFLDLSNTPKTGTPDFNDTLLSNSVDMGSSIWK